VEITGVVEGPLDSSHDKLYFTLKVEQLRHKRIDRQASGSIAVIAGVSDESARNDYQLLALSHGARMRVMTIINREDNFRNPGVSPFTEYLDRRGYDASSFIKSPLLIERLDNEAVFVPLSLLYKWRTIIQAQIDRQFSPQTAGVLDAAFLGNRYNLTASATERFREGGTFHVLVISGLHISFIGGLVLLISRRLTKRTALQFALSVVVLWGYTLAVGGEASVVRAALMFTLMALGPVIFRNSSSLNTLGGAALVLLVWHPANLFDPSFQLTFLCVLAIVALAWPIMHALSAIGSWQPNRTSPYPPRCSQWLCSFSESLFWSNRKWEREMSRTVYKCRLFKTPVALTLERCRAQKPARYIVSALVISASVQIVLLPLLINYFHRLSIASLVLNIVVSLMMAALALASLLALLVAQLSASAAIPFTSLTNGLSWLMVHSVDPVANLGLASTRMPHYSGRAAVVYWLYYLPLAILIIRLNRWRPLALTPIPFSRSRTTVFISICQVLLMGLILLHPFSAGRADGKVHVDFLDVGQGDAALVTLPDGATLLIDGGGRPNFARTGGDESGLDEEQFGHETRSIGEAVVSEYLWWRGLDTIDYVLATHADADHLDGLNDVARNFRVRSALVARAPDWDREFRQFFTTLTNQRIPVSLIGAGDVLRFGSVHAKVLWPTGTRSVNAPSGNNDSVALRLDLGENSVLLTGDIEGGAEQAIMDQNQDLDVDVVKVPHHGSKTSSTLPFVLKTSPSLAVISVGQSSVFDHPNREVIERWTAVGARVLTTGKSGTVFVTMDGLDMSVTTFVKAR
jgi:competence protein ComEC